MEEFIAQLMPAVISIAVTCLTAIAGYVGNAIKKYIEEKAKDFKEKADAETKRKVVETTCRYVEQIYYDLDGPSKLEKAKENIILLLNEKGVPITELEMNVLIESTVNSFKDAVK